MLRKLRAFFVHTLSRLRRPTPVDVIIDERLTLQRHFSVLTKFAWCHTAVCANACRTLCLPKATTDRPSSGSL